MALFNLCFGPSEEENEINKQYQKLKNQLKDYMAS